jgi:hypothetical protein
MIHNEKVHTKWKTHEIGPLNLVKVKKLDAKLVTKAHFYNLEIMEILLLRVVQIDKKTHPPNMKTRV